MLCSESPWGLYLMGTLYIPRHSFSMRIRHRAKPCCKFQKILKSTQFIIVFFKLLAGSKMSTDLKHFGSGRDYHVLTMFHSLSFWVHRKTLFPSLPCSKEESCDSYSQGNINGSEHHFQSWPWGSMKPLNRRRLGP